MTAARFIVLAVLLAAFGAARALPGDNEQPISVEADNLEIRDGEKISVYDGNVVLVQGSLKISSDRLVIHFNDASELVLMEMTGSPARFRQLDDQSREIIGEARYINYREADAELELTESAELTHAGDHIESERIRVNTRNNTIQAGGTQSDQRVKMLLRPRQNTATSE